MKPTQCPQCGSEEYTAYSVQPGHGDPSQTYCVCDSCEHEFDGLTPEEAQ